MMAELFGKETGYNMGRSSSMHITSPDLGIIGSSSVVAAGIPIAAGIGLSIKMRKTDQVVVSFFGDGAANNGNFHEGLNFAAVWKLPVVFVCENNMYAVSVPVSKSTSIEDISIRANSYGIMGYTINGMNVIEVANVVGEAVERARKGDGPTLIECKTYRFRAHGEGETLKYRANEEIQIWRERCPIQNLKERLIKTKILNEEEVSKIEHEVISEIEKAVQFAKESSFPQPIKEMRSISTPQLEEVIKI
jgi:TPP-dependent pyruvate/acetoin dehydrogenase alpha subunit